MDVYSLTMNWMFKLLCCVTWTPFIILNCNNPVSKLDWFYWIPIWTSQTKTGIEDLQKLLLKMGGKGPPIEGSSTNLDTNAVVVKVSTHTNHPISVRGTPVESPIGVTPALASMMQPNQALWPGFSTKAQYKGVATQSLPQPNPMATPFSLTNHLFHMCSFPYSTHTTLYS